MSAFSDTDLLRDEDVRRIKAIVVRQGLPAEWCDTPEFRANLTRMFTALGGNKHAMIAWVSDFMTGPRLQKRLWALAGSVGGVGSAMLLARTLMVAAFDQPGASVDPHETYAPIEGFAADYPLELVDLKDHESFFYQYEDASGAVNEACVDKALSLLSPDVVAIGSGPACSAALASIYDHKPNAQVMVFDVGDYSSQADYDALSPAAVGIQSYRGGGSTLIVNGPTRVSANFIPQVWGGGGEIFSGTAHALPDWYRDRLPMPTADAIRHEERVRRDCRVSTTRWDILNDAQKRFFKGAEAIGFAPYMLEGFGRGGDLGQGRCYAGKKGRIPYLDEMFRRRAPIVGLANCRVDAIERANDGSVAALQLSFLSRRTRRTIATRVLELPARTSVLLGAGSMGDQRILAASGDALAVRLRAGVLHQYTSEVAALYDEPLSANGIPQGVGVCVEPDTPLSNGDMQRRICVEGAHPGRALLAAMGMSGASDNLQTWRALPRVGTAGIMFTESKPGRQLILGDTEMTLQRLVQADFDRCIRGMHAAARMWQAGGARAVGLNLGVRFSSKDPQLRALGFAGVEEIDALMAHAKRHPPIMQVFYRTGHRFGSIDASSGEVRGFKGLHLVGEDAIPPGPGVNPTLAILMLAHSYGERIAASW